MRLTFALIVQVFVFDVTTLPAEAPEKLVTPVDRGLWLPATGRLHRD